MTYTPPVRYTADEIEEAIDCPPEDHSATCPTGDCLLCEWDDGEHGWQNIGYGDPGNTYDILLKGETVKAVYIDGESGGEGSGESIWAVIKVGSQYFLKSGYYASYDGSNWDGDVKEVKRKQHTVTIWE